MNLCDLFRFANAIFLTHCTCNFVRMLIIIKTIFHFICLIGRFFRKIFQFIVGRRHETSPKTEPVTLEHIRIIGEMESDSHSPYQSFASTPKVNHIIIFFS